MRSSVEKISCVPELIAAKNPANLNFAGIAKVPTFFLGDNRRRHMISEIKSG
jgi:hypothetical protein